MPIADVQRLLRKPRLKQGGLERIVEAYYAKTKYDHLGRKRPYCDTAFCRTGAWGKSPLPGSARAAPCCGSRGGPRSVWGAVRTRVKNTDPIDTSDNLATLEVDTDRCAKTWSRPAPPSCQG